MLFDCFKKLHDIITEADRPVVLTVPSMPRGDYWFRKSPGGEFERVEETIQYPDTRVRTLESFLRMVEHDYPLATQSKMEIGVSGTGSFAVFGKGERKSWTITWLLDHSEQWAAVADLRGEGSMSHKQLMRWLNVSVSGCVDEAVLARLAQLSIRKGAGLSSSQKLGAESIAHDVKREALVGGAGEELPATIVIGPLQCFEGLDYETSIECALDLDLEEATFTLTPLSGELYDAEEHTLLYVMSSIETGLVHLKPVVYLGPG